MRRSPLWAGLILITLACLAFSMRAQAASGIAFLVNSTGDQPEAAPDNQCETAVGNGVCTLRAAIQLVIARNNGGDGIFFNIPASDPGCSGGVCTIFLGSALPDVSVSVEISGPGSNKLSIDGGGVQFGNRVFNVTTAGTVNFLGLAIVNGFTQEGQFGAAIQNVNGGTVNITNCELSNNQSSEPRNGFVGGGGAIFNASSGTVNITNSVLASNSASAFGGVSFGGGIWNKTGTINVSNSTFDHNEIDNQGGAIWNDAGIITVTASTFTQNSAVAGGAIGSGGGTVSITNSTFYANIAYAFDGGVGGAISNTNPGALNLTNSTLTANFSNLVGGGVFNNSPSGGGVVNVKSTIIAGNLGGTGTPNFGVGPDVFGPFSSQGFNLIGKKDGSTGFTAATDKKGTIASPLNPGLDWRGLRSNGGPTQTVALLAGSPAIDKGTSNGLTGKLTTDQRGLARTVDNPSIPNAPGGDGTDIGAFEFGAH